MLAVTADFFISPERAIHRTAEFSCAPEIPTSFHRMLFILADDSLKVSQAGKFQKVIIR